MTASPYSPYLKKSSGFSFKARYVNDVHLPRFAADCQIRSDRFCHCQSRSDRFCQSATYTEQPPAARCTTGDSKDFSPSNNWNDSKSAVLRQLPRATENQETQARMLLPNRRRLPVSRKTQLLDWNRRAAVEQVFQSHLPLALRCNASQAVATNRKHSEHSVIADFHRRMPRQILLRNLGTDANIQKDDSN